MLSRQFAWDVVQEDHQIDRWSIVVADVKQHARKRTIWVVRVHTLRGTVAAAAAAARLLNENKVCTSTPAL